MRIQTALLKFALQVAAVQRAAMSRRGDDPERGDVPGWVFVTMMSAALATALYVIAGDALETMLETALAAVSIP